MKCIFCGAELKEGCLFCSSCGKEVQIVPDYNEFDDDYLNKLVGQDDEIGLPPNIDIVNTSEEQVTVHSPERNDEKEKKKIKQQRVKMIILSSFAALIAMCVIAVCVVNRINYKHDNSFEYQKEKAVEAFEEKDYELALTYYNRAIELEPKELSVRFSAADIYVLMKEMDSAIKVYKDIIKIDSKNVKAYEALISIWDESKAYDLILELSESADSSLKKLFKEYMVSPPYFSRGSGTYSHFFELKLSTDGDYKILYTLDGSDPTESGLEYTEAIKIDTEDMYRVKACCVNAKGLFSEIITKEFVLSVAAPKMATVSPDGGDFVSETSVTISVPEGCIAYYTWNGTTPSSSSSRYYSALKVPKGDNVLSVVIYNTETKKYSEVYRGRFKYTPERKNEYVSDVYDDKTPDGSMLEDTDDDLDDGSDIDEDDE